MALSIIDCDVHAVLPSIGALLPYLPAYWKEQIAQTGFKGPIDHWHPPGLATSVRDSAKRPDGKPASSSVEAVTAGVFQAAPHPSYAILHADSAVESLHNPDAAQAIASALNEWLSEQWLSADPRLRASIVVASQFPEIAAREIDLRAGDPRFVQVLLPVRSEAPYGSRNHKPIFAAAARAGRPVVLHYGGAPGNPSTPVGWPSLHLEEYSGMTGVFQTQLISLVCSGVLDEFPDLMLVFAESGFTWLPSTLWRFDKNWKGLRREIPWVKKPPSEIVLERVKFTTAPMDAPADPAQFREVLGQLGSDSMLLYASDFPHEHAEPTALDWTRALPQGQAERILSLNARALYRL